MPPPRRPRPVHWYTIPVRVLLVTFIGTLLCFALSLLLGIFGTVILASLHRVRPDMTAAYRHIAMPVALAAAGVIFVAMLVTEIRRYREARALHAIERMS
jgi:uncharacterized membrane protein